MKALHKELLRLGKGKSSASHLQIETTEFDTLLGVDEVATRLYFLLTLAGLGKQRYPMCKYDPKLTKLLNGKKFFPTQIGGKFESQRGEVLKRLTEGMPSGFIFVERYSFQRAAWIPHLWTIDFNIDGGKLHCTVQFGHCQLFPMLPYEITGIVAMIQWMRRMTGLNDVKCVWQFISIENAAKRSFKTFGSFKKLPETAAIAELVRVEETIREAQKLTTVPVLRYPVPAELDSFIDELYRRWHGRK